MGNGVYLMPKDKIVIPSKEGKRLDALEVENAELWFENLVQKGESESNKKEIADLWFVQLTGGTI